MDTMQHPPIRLMLVDDHSVVRMGFAALLEAEEDLRVVVEADSAAQALAAYQQHQPDVVLMDVRMPGGSGLTALRQICAEFPKARVIILTTYDLDEPMLAASDAGASGYLLKSVKREELTASIRHVHGGGCCFPASLQQRLKAREQSKRLTPREVETLELLRRGLSNKEIATSLKVSDHTAKAHVKAVLQKLGAADRTGAVTTGFEKGLLEVH